ncbi:MAG: DeoR/GlpR family DNA-binding transcription regulator [Verrucomicrobiota bacterium]
MKTDALNARQQTIIGLLRERGNVSVTDLTRQFDVTSMTVRRDLDHLEQHGYLTRTHGGALFSQQVKIQFAFREKQEHQLAEKAAIARAAARLVQPGMTIVLDTGTTTLEVARAVAGIANLKVLTSSLAIASVLYARDNIDLILLGGNARKNSPDLTGPLTEDNLRQLRVGLAILGADALDRDGLYTGELAVARISKAMIAAAGRTILVADSTKFQRRAFVRFAGWEQVDTLITDPRLPSADRRWLSKAIQQVVLAPVLAGEETP